MGHGGNRLGIGITGLALASCLVLVGCTGDAEGDDAKAANRTTTVATPSTTTSPAATGPSAAEGAVRTTLTVDGVPLQVAVDPVVVDGDLALLSIIAQPAPGTAVDDLRDTSLRYLWSDPHRYATGSAQGISGVRVLDLAAGSVAMVAMDDRRRAVIADQQGDLLGPDQTPTPGRFVAAIGAPTSATVDVLLPSAGLVLDVPVVRDGAPGAVAEAFRQVEGTLPSSITPRTLDLTSYTTEAEETVRTTRRRDAVSVAVDSDVLFASDSAKLSGRADGTLRRAARALEQAGPQKVEIVGHTDDVASDAYNLTLSKQRAQAVARRLAKLAALDGVTVSVRGRGEAEPAVRGTSDEARARNRRVELRYTVAGAPAGGGGPTSTEAMPKARGVVVRGTGPVRVVDTWDDDARYTVAVEKVLRHNGYLVGQLSVTLDAGEDDGRISILGSGNFASDGRFAPELGGSVSRVTLLQGRTLSYPVQYEAKAARDGQDGMGYPLGDVFLQEPEPGVARTVTVVWPDPGTDTVTIDTSVPQWLIRTAKKGIDVSTYRRDYPAVRFVDVPVTTS